MAAQVNGMIALEKVEGTTIGNDNGPTGWKDDGKTLIAPNGIPVVHGFRDYVLAHIWDANNFPLAPEQVISSGSIEPGNAAIGPGSRQDFRLSSLGWTTTRNVYVIYCRAGYPGADTSARRRAGACHTAWKRSGEQPAPASASGRPEGHGGVGGADGTGEGA